MRVGALFALLAAMTMMLGLMRWPSVHWELASAWEAAGLVFETVGHAERAVGEVPFDDPPPLPEAGRAGAHRHHRGGHPRS